MERQKQKCFPSLHPLPCGPLAAGHPCAPLAVLPHVLKLVRPPCFGMLLGRLQPDTPERALFASPWSTVKEGSFEFLGRKILLWKHHLSYSMGVKH